MPFSSGTYSLPSGNPVVTGTTISSSTTNTTNSDIATALSSCILKDGTQTITANLPMASHKLTGLSAGTTAGDSVEYAGSPSFTNLAYTGTLTGSTGILNIGSGQVYKDASGNVGIGTSSPNKQLQIQYGSTNSGQLQITNNSTGTTATDGVLFGYDTSNDVIINNQEATATKLYTSGTERARIDSSGNLLVGTTSNTVNNSNSFVYRQDLGAEILNHINGTVTGSQYIYFGYNGSVIGSVTQNLTTGVLYNVSSDQRLKTNIQPAGSAIQSILDFPVDQFDWISNSSHQDFGGVAQKILKVIPEMVSVPENPEEMMGVDWSKAVPRLIKTIQELKAIIDTQQEQINSLLGK